MFLKEGNKVFHYGTNKSVTGSDNYFPFPIGVPINKPAETELNIILDDIKDKNLDYVLASSIPTAMSKHLHSKLQELNLPYFFVSPEMTALENNKTLTKQMLNFLKIPTGTGKEVTGKELFETFKTIPRPFVIKMNFIYHFGKQTILVDDNNWEEVYHDLFSIRLDDLGKITNIRLDAKIMLEEVVKIKKEYSYHMLVNDTNWQYLGSARDYKKIEDSDRGFNSVSMGAYNTDDVDPIVHQYADQIYNFLKSKGYKYTGFMFLGIAVDEQNIPHILEINTRAGDPEIQVILGSVKNNLGELFYAASANKEIPIVEHNNKKVVTVRLVNTIYDWTKPASFLPKLKEPTKDIICGIEGNERYIKHSVFTTSDETHELAAKKIYDYLDKQFVGQYRYRRDIGILK
jgi:phosphoribosylamine--glycine ligase